MSEKKKLIRADEAQVLLLDKLVQEIKDLNNRVREQTPQGIVEPLSIIIATPSRRVIHPPLNKRWFSVSIVDDGPSDCYVIVNSEKSTTSPSIVRVGEPCEIDFGSPLIEDIVVWCETGTASLRIRGVR